MIFWVLANVTCIIYYYYLYDYSYHQYGGSSNTSSNQTIIPIVVDSFNGAVLIVRVDKRPGMERENLLKQDEEKEGGGERGEEEEGFMGSMFGR